MSPTGWSARPCVNRSANNAGIFITRNLCDPNPRQRPVQSKSQIACNASVLQYERNPTHTLPLPGGDDRERSRTGNSPDNPAALGRLAISLLRKDRRGLTGWQAQPGRLG